MEMADLTRLLTFVANDETTIITTVMAVLLIVGWTLAVTCCVQLVSCVERATHCHHHEDVAAIPRRLRESLRAECKDFCLRVASSNASGQQITRTVALQHAFDAFSGSNTGFIADAKEDVRPELWAPSMRSLAIDVFVERNQERAMMLTRCATILDSICQVSSDASSDDVDGVVEQDRRGTEKEEEEQEQEEETALRTTLLHLATWSNCGCLRRHICSKCGASDFAWIGHLPDETERMCNVSLLPMTSESLDDDLTPRYCEICRETIDGNGVTGTRRAAKGNRGKVD